MTSFKVGIWILERGCRTWRPGAGGSHAAIDAICTKWKDTFAEFSQQPTLDMLRTLHNVYTIKIHPRISQLSWNAFAHGDNQLRNHMYKYKTTTSESKIEPSRHPIDGGEQEREVEDVAMIDWTLSGTFPAVFDLLYFIYASRIPSDPEYDLICAKAYHTMLCEKGVKDYSWDDFILDFQYGILHMVVSSFVDLNYITPESRVEEVKFTPVMAKWFESTDHCIRRVLQTATHMHQHSPSLFSV